MIVLSHILSYAQIFLEVPTEDACPYAERMIQYFLIANKWLWEVFFKN